LVGTTKVYPGVGADIVMESISLIDRIKMRNGLLETVERNLALVEIVKK
jgi:hypothetical protein